jgi:hypothetical protein
MIKAINVQYVGFAAKPLVREYNFIVRGALNQTTEFTLTIGMDSFGAGRVRIQDAPDICSLRLHRELAASGEDHPSANYDIGDIELDDYRKAHPTKAVGPYSYKPKPAPDA